jgi:hypothetical protein
MRTGSWDDEPRLLTVSTYSPDGMYAEARRRSTDAWRTFQTPLIVAPDEFVFLRRSVTYQRPCRDLTWTALHMRRLPTYFVPDATAGSTVTAARAPATSSDAAVYLSRLVMREPSADWPSAFSGLTMKASLDERPYDL